MFGPCAADQVEPAYAYAVSGEEKVRWLWMVACRVRKKKQGAKGYKEELFYASDDTTEDIWAHTSKTCVTTFERHLSTVTSTAITEDGWTLLSGAEIGMC
ncbi:hypothetical protein L1887_34993 [Cichorium endivia]|nr:hypothetical protein L1887_34993 [Cichorium endivia]